MLTVGRISMADTQFSDHFSDDISEVCPVIDMRNQDFVFFIHSLPIYSMHIFSVEEISHLPPTFIVDLHPFLMIVDVFFQVRSRNRVIYTYRGIRDVDDLKSPAWLCNCFFITRTENDPAIQICFLPVFQVICTGITITVEINLITDHMQIVVISCWDW